MKISVIIPCYNQGDLAVKAIESAISQTRPPDQIVVADDGSDEDIPGSLSVFGDEVKVVRQENSGPSAARNLAAKNSDGDWLALLDADDLWLPGKLEEQERLISRMGEAVLSHTDGWVVDGHGVPPDLSGVPTHFSRLEPPSGGEAWKTYLSSNPLLTSSVMIKRQAFELAGGFDESFRINEDADLFLRIMAGGGEVAFLPKPLMVQRCGPQGLGRDQLANLESSIRLLEKASREFSQLENIASEGMKKAHRVAAWYAMREGESERARKHWLASIRGKPSKKELLTALYLLLPANMGLGWAKNLWKDTINLLTKP